MRKTISSYLSAAEKTEVKKLRQEEGSFSDGFMFEILPDIIKKVNLNFPRKKSLKTLKIEDDQPAIRRLVSISLAVAYRRYSDQSQPAISPKTAFKRAYAVICDPDAEGFQSESY